MHAVNIRLKETRFVNFSGKKMLPPLSGVCALAAIATDPASIIKCYFWFNVESRHLLNLSVQNAIDCISESFNFLKFSRGAFPRIPQESRPVSLGPLYPKILRPPLFAPAPNHAGKHLRVNDQTPR